MNKASRNSRKASSKESRSSQDKVAKMRPNKKDVARMLVMKSRKLSEKASPATQSARKSEKRPKKQVSIATMSMRLWTDLVVPLRIRRRKPKKEGRRERRR